MQILLVDDDAIFLDITGRLLRRNGHLVSTALSALKGLALLREAAAKGSPFQVVLSDWQMPEMSGFELAEAVHADARTANLPIIALSALTSPEAIERGRQVGFHDYIAKFDRPGLIAALKEQTANMGEAA